MSETKFIFVTGGVLSSLGKGLASAVIGMLLEARGLSVTIQKLDPYINIDPGTMSPYQHGEVFVTDDGSEADLDLGHYERFTKAKIGGNNNFTTGQIYKSVIEKERKGEFLGKTVQVIPHITNEIKKSIKLVAKDVDIVIVEIGGTIGDIESQPFLEAIRQLRIEMGRENSLFIHLTLVPYMVFAGEFKTKPTQHSVRELRSIGIQPDIILCRAKEILSNELKQKISLFCNVDVDAVITARDAENIYEVPLIYSKEGLGNKIIEILKIDAKEPNLKEWKELFANFKNTNMTTKIAIVGKYANSTEAYKSIYEALAHAGLANHCKIEIDFILSSDLETDKTKLKGYDGILVPGGFDKKGIEGKILASKYARENNIPYFGICLGMHTAVIDIARNIAKMEEANSTEFDKNTPYPVIYLMKKWFDDKKEREVTRDINSKKGGTMRLGAYATKLTEGSLAREAYGEEIISERHRHRYEFNNKYIKKLEENSLLISGTSPDGSLVECIELKKHKWFFACQFHPEFKSKPTNPHPIFTSFIKASCEKKQT